MEDFRSFGKSRAKTYKWPIGSVIERHEHLQIQLLSYNKYFNNKIIGFYVLPLKDLVENGNLSIRDALTDLNHKITPVNVDFEVHYVKPNDDGPSWNGLVPLEKSLDEDRQKLIAQEKSFGSVKKGMDSKEKECFRVYDKSERRTNISRSNFLRGKITSEKLLLRDRQRAARAFKSVRNLIRFTKYKPKRRCDDDEQKLLKDEEFLKIVKPQDSGSNSGSGSSVESASSLESIEVEKDPVVRSEKSQKMKLTLASVANAILKSQDFQICITIIEARQLAGLNIDPVVCVQVGEQKKYTSVKESTNCPYYNEYFVFDFRTPPVILLDKIITLSVFQARSLLRPNRLLGSFKLDVATLWSQPDHQFYHKWALLTYPDDTIAGPKGYLKCDMSVLGKGDTIKVPLKSEKDEDDIEANLLIPAGITMERQRARFIFKIYRAEGLPKMNSSIVANVKKALTGETKDLVDPYVQISFAGLTGKTSVKKHTYSPVWNEQITFYEMFPPLCQRIKIELWANDQVNSTIIGTHFIDLKTISNDGEKGFLPTYGPNFVHIYGSTRDYSLIDEHSNLNYGLGEGVSYRARILLAIRTEIASGIDLLTNDVEVEPIFPVQEALYGKDEEFFLFASILSATMINKKIGDKHIYFELSIGNSGNVVDGYNMTSSGVIDSEGNNSLESVRTDFNTFQSTTISIKPMTYDKIYYFLPYWDNKPCMNTVSIWPDLRKRMYNSNMISKIADNLENGLLEINNLLENNEESNAEKKLKSVLEDLSASCENYFSDVKDSAADSELGKTKLDKERLTLCQSEIANILTKARNLKALITRNSFKARYKTVGTYLQKLRFLEDDPQQSLPDVFIWALSGTKRLAYYRIPARDIIYSVKKEECGRECAKVQTLFLKLPGKQSLGPSGWTIQIKLQVYMWLGLLKHKKNFLNGMPIGYEISNEIKNAERPLASSPKVIRYNSVQMRAYVYQARSLIGSDASGLSDPLARVIIEEHCRTTQVLDETLSPTWDELLIFDEILIWGTREHIKQDPPTIIIEVFDQDRVGKSEFIGRAIAKPYVKLYDEANESFNCPPLLEWHQIIRGLDQAGELLACFELIEMSKNQKTFPPLPSPKEKILKGNTVIEINSVPIFPVPKEIRPTLARYRIEVLFWGLRDLKRIHLLTVHKPRIDIECAGHILHSSIIQNAKKNPNFGNLVKFLDLDLPEQEMYRPPLTIRAVDCRSFGRYTLVGTHTINSIHKYMHFPVMKNGSETKDSKNITPCHDLQRSSFLSKKKEKIYSSFGETTTFLSRDEAKCSNKKEIKFEAGETKQKGRIYDVDDFEESKDWWTKYFASIENTMKEDKEFALNKPNKHILTSDGSNIQNFYNLTNKNGKKEDKKSTMKLVSRLSCKKNVKKIERKTATLKMYSSALENQPEFKGFKEWLLNFDLYRGKKTGDEVEDESRVVGTFKGAIKVYKLPQPINENDHAFIDFDPQQGFFQGLPSNDPMHVLVRVYIIKANDLHPMDMNGKADPYVVLQLGSKRISDKDNYVSKQLNPVFGKCFEIEATFPQDAMLTVQIFDWDLVGSDEMIGETKIDLENRFYSRHRATCGISSRYDTCGYNRWRDPMKPSQILSKLCKDGKLDFPVYSQGKITIGKQTFTVEEKDAEICEFSKDFEEHLALFALQKWHEVPRVGCHLVPEHIETRPLYNPDRPSIEQGKLEMWVDMFPMDMPLPGPPVDISPRKPKSYELRVIIWNTDEVVLEDDAFFTGEKMSDIYVKGWLKGPEDCQYTDIHFRSLTGEGNFNWRFIYPFDYLAAEEKIVISRKESMFSWDETECKIPARLQLQVWDADHFSADDFLGAITLDLNRFPRGAKTSKHCTLDMLKMDDSASTINIFKQKRLKGWWPFFIKKENDEIEMTGKVEAEIYLLTKEEAEKNPAGYGRSEPDPLEKPNRPDSSFVWFTNPLKSVRYIMWYQYKWVILKCVVILALAVIILLFFYSIPGYTVKKLLGA